MNIEKTVYDKLMEIHNTEQEIIKIREEKQAKFNNLKNILSQLGFKIETCKNCMGNGKVQYSYGYQDGCTGTTDCSCCHGTGYRVLPDNTEQKKDDG